MKTIRLVSTILILLMATGQLQAKKVQLRYQLKMDQTYQIETVTNSVIVQDVMGTQMEVTGLLTMVSEAKVLSAVEGDLYSIEQRITRIVLSTKTPNGDMEYDTGSGEEAPDWAADIMLMLNDPFQYNLSTTGKILSMELPAKLREKLGDSESVVGLEQMMSGLAGSFGSAEGLQTMIQNQWFIFPDEPVATRKMWKFEGTSQQAMAMKVSSEYTLVKSSKSSHEIRIAGSLSSSDTAEPIEVQGMFLDFSLAGTKEGSSTIDSVTGITLESNVVSNISGVIIIEGDQLPEPFSMPMSYKINEKVTFKEIQ